MAKDGSVAPKERVNIVYKPATGDDQGEKELPLKLLVLGDFTLRDDDTPIEDRKVINVDKNNFNEVLSNQNISVSMNVPNKLSDDAEDEELPVTLDIKSMKDFEPESVARQVPALRQLLEVREALTALKGPLGNMPAFRKALQSALEDEATRQKLLSEISTSSNDGDAG